MREARIVITMKHQNTTHRPRVLKERGMWYAQCHNCTVSHRVSAWHLAMYLAFLHHYNYDRDPGYDTGAN